MTTHLKLLLNSLGIALFFVSTAAAQVADPLPLTPVPEVASDGLSIIYSVETGNLAVQATGGTSLTTIQLDSQTGLFNGNCVGLFGPFDVCSSDKVFTINTDGFETIDFGNVLESGLPWEELEADLLANGSSSGGGFDVGSGPFLVHAGVPEPSGLIGLITGIGLLFAWRRKSA
ncbi:MAG: PEP-CTERM sorting domain-containing protein [Planctomycetaceae bacterium]|nr:PEP-CTERM sorting domain-containing protein [Planctomycetaceae bacterium]